ncbi:hypothetical protein GDO78_022584 [Eleutherodactylus coqui]|uniref:Uncharacterized protein n=1 Tax=Eleutherodactylus coqui TaxID=57060 RepID=A0A8J6BG98_ELECQ|nr:hypothetical protein GDO78_022584 [Eleutherodactylus coqui]
MVRFFPGRTELTTLSTKMQRGPQLKERNITSLIFKGGPLPEGKKEVLVHYLAHLLLLAKKLKNRPKGDITLGVSSGRWTN